MYKEGWGIQPRPLDGLGRQGGDALQVPGLEVDLDVNGGLLDGGLAEASKPEAAFQKLVRRHLGNKREIFFQFLMSSYVFEVLPLKVFDR